MNRSENSQCSCNKRIISRFVMHNTVVGTTAVAALMRTRLAGQTPFAEEVAWAQHGHDGFLSSPDDNTESLTPPLWR